MLKRLINRTPDAGRAKLTERRINIGNPWHAVAVKPGTRACGAAQQLAPTRFLSGEAPQIPLPSCVCRTDCQCTYRHFEDRRSGGRRASDEGLPTPYFPGREQRRSNGRRRTDHF